MAPVTRPTWTALLAALTLTLACEGDRSAGPDLSDSLEPAITCSKTCIVASTVAPLAAARQRPDSAAYPVRVAEVLLRGAPGGTINLSLNASTGLRQAFAGQGHLFVTIGARQPRTVPLAALSDPGVELFKFDSEDTVRVTYHLARDLQGTLKGTFELVQRLSRGTVLTSSRPYAPRSGKASLLGPCPIGSSDFASVCGILVTIIPWAPGDHFGATFQSEPSAGASSPIGVTLVPAVKSVTVTIYDPTWAGNEMVAKDKFGVDLGRLSFAYSGEPGNNIPETRTIAVSGIRRVDLIPSTGGPHGDYVAYDMNIVPDSACDPIWPDPWLKDPDVQQGMNSQWQAEWDKGFDRKEPGGWIVEDLATGDFELVPGEVLYQDQCEMQLDPTPPALPGKATRAWWHGHVLTPNLPVPASCRNFRAGDVVGNGPSNDDLDFSGESGYPGYTLDENQLFKAETNGNWNGMPWTKDNFCRP